MKRKMITSQYEDKKEKNHRMQHSFCVCVHAIIIISAYTHSDGLRLTHAVAAVLRLLANLWIEVHVVYALVKFV